MSGNSPASAFLSLDKTTTESNIPGESSTGEDGLASQNSNSSDTPSPYTSITTDVEQLQDIGRQIFRVVDSNGPPAMLLQLLLRLDEFIATEHLLRRSKIGTAVGNLRQHGDQEVTNTAHELIWRWERDLRAAQSFKKEQPPETVDARSLDYVRKKHPDWVMCDTDMRTTIMTTNESEAAEWQTWQARQDRAQLHDQISQAPETGKVTQDMVSQRSLAMRIDDKDGRIASSNGSSDDFGSLLQSLRSLVATRDFLKRSSISVAATRLQQNKDRVIADAACELV